MAEIYLAKISSLVERFCEQIGDEHMVLADNIIQSRHKAVMLMLVEKSDTDDIAVLAFSYNLRKRSITEIKTFDRQNCEAIEKFVSAKLIGNFMDKIADVCDSSKCEYLFENGNIYYIGEEGMVKSWVANINGFNVDKVAEIFNKAEEQGEKPFKKDIGGSDYLLIPKDVVDKILGRDKDRVCASLAESGVIYYSKGDGKNNNDRYSYRSRIKGDSGKVETIYYFGVKAEIYEAAVKGGESLSA